MPSVPPPDSPQPPPSDPAPGAGGPVVPDPPQPPAAPPPPPPPDYWQTVLHEITEIRKRTSEIRTMIGIVFGLGVLGLLLTIANH